MNSLLALKRSLMIICLGLLLVNYAQSQEEECIQNLENARCKLSTATGKETEIMNGLHALANAATTASTGADSAITSLIGQDNAISEGVKERLVIGWMHDLMYIPELYKFGPIDDGKRKNFAVAVGGILKDGGAYVNNMSSDTFGTDNDAFSEKFRGMRKYLKTTIKKVEFDRGQKHAMDTPFDFELLQRIAGQDGDDSHISVRDIEIFGGPLREYIEELFRTVIGGPPLGMASPDQGLVDGAVAELSVMGGGSVGYGNIDRFELQKELPAMDQSALDAIEGVYGKLQENTLSVRSMEELIYCAGNTGDAGCELWAQTRDSFEEEVDID